MYVHRGKTQTRLKIEKKPGNKKKVKIKQTEDSSYKRATAALLHKRSLGLPSFSKEIQVTS